MQITSVSFALFAAALLAVYYLIPKKGQWLLLLAASYVFYLWAGTEYLVFILLRAGLLGKSGVIEDAGSPYPYPFLDVSVLGGFRVAGICFILYGLCIAAGLAVIAFIRILTAAFGDGYPLFLI